ncbi:GL19923 [Drosophila persimilis]|uniref:GL19923 n=1 Tax=Drosophila persimilis TaxID=7234 RepID=B4GYH5_DROPE|nr:GL19923 [Drosophila persimilis]
MMPEIIICVFSLMGSCYSALVNLLSKLVGYFRIWFMYHWTASSPRKSLRPYLYKIDLYVWQIIYGTPDTGQVVLFDSWLNEPPVECDDCRLKRVGELIDQAKICLDVVLLSTANIQYLKRVLAAHNRGVNVRILASEKMLAAKGPSDAANLRL